MESTSETSVAAAELFVAGGRRVIMDGETIVYSLSNWVDRTTIKDQTQELVHIEVSD